MTRVSIFTSFRTMRTVFQPIVRGLERRNVERLPATVLRLADSAQVLGIRLSHLRGHSGWRFLGIGRAIQHRSMKGHGMAELRATSSGELLP